MEIQCPCPSCDALLAVDSQYVGCLVQCPVCSAEFVLKQPEVSQAVPVAAPAPPGPSAAEPAPLPPTSPEAAPSVAVPEAAGEPAVAPEPVPAPPVAAQPVEVPPVAVGWQGDIAGAPADHAGETPVPRVETPAPDGETPVPVAAEEEIVAQPAAPARGKQCPECGMQLLPGNTKCPECGYDADLAGIGVGEELPRFMAQEIRRTKASPAAARQRKKWFALLSGTVTAVVLLGIIALGFYTVLAQRGANAPKPQQRSATLSLDWPLEERFTGQVTIDGAAKNVPSGGPQKIAYPLTPGKHRVVVRRDGCKPIEMDLELGEGETLVLRPDWVLAPLDAADAPAAKPATPAPKPAASKREGK